MEGKGTVGKQHWSGARESPVATNTFGQLRDGIMRDCKVLATGENYQAVRRRVWDKMFFRYCLSPHEETKALYDRDALLKLRLKYLLEFSPLRVGARPVTDHWR